MSKYPSSNNPFKKKKKIKSLRKKGGKADGQKGHKGTNLKQTQNPDIIKPLNVCGICDCGSDLSQAECIENKSLSNEKVLLLNCPGKRCSYKEFLQYNIKQEYG